MWIPGQHHTHKDRPASRDELASVKGKLDADQARIWFVNFCKHNLHFTTQLLTGVKIAPIQELKLRAFFLRDFILDVEGRGNGKTFVASIFIVLYALFTPGCRIGICSAAFRQSKLIFRQIEKFISGEHGGLLRQCVNGKIMHSSDLHEMTLGSSTIVAVPLTEKIRGLRFNVVVIDELLLVPPEIIDSVILPFLSATQDGMEHEKLKDAETKLIQAGRLTEGERTLPTNNKILGLSSASFKFESLYKNYYEPYLRRICDPKAEGVNHALIRLSYEAAPKGLMNMKVIEEARSKSSKATFDREFRAIFTDDGSGYFSIQSIIDASVPVGHQPCLRVKGQDGKKYILGIDPNYSQSETADHFAMCLIEIDEEKKTGALVHAYALANSKINKRSIYLSYLLEHFNIVYIIMDNAGGPSFISDAEQFLGAFPKPISQFEDTFLDGEEGLRAARKQYNPNTGKIIHSQTFNTKNWIRLANDALQYHLEHKKILFGAPLLNDKSRDLALRQKIPIEDLEFLPEKSADTLEKMQDFVDHQNYLVDLTKKELTLIEVTSSSSGHQTFDLPANIRVTKDPSRARRDSYTALLLASWGLKCYFDLNREVEEACELFMPKWVA